MGSYLYCPKCNEYLGSLGGDCCGCGWEQAPFEEPQQRTWEGLSVFEINDLVENTEYEDYCGLVEAVEAKLKEKNA